MSLRSVKLALQALPYTEMKALAQQVHDVLPKSPTHVAIADTLSSLPIEESNEEIKTEAYWLKRAFTPRRGNLKRLEVRAQSNGLFEASLDDWKHVDNDVRSAVSGLLDLIAGYEALRK